MDASTAWEESWPEGPDGEPILIPGKHLDQSVQYRLEKALREAADLWEEQRAGFSATSPVVAYEPPADPAGWHQYFAELAEDLPLHEWSVERANIHSRLVAMRNDLFRDILKRSSGAPEKKVKKKVGFLDWPNSITEDDWRSVREKISFVPDVILDRLATTQPFRDNRPDGSPPSADYVRQGGVQSSRKEANDDKHERTPILGMILTCPEGILTNFSFKAVAFEHRNFRNSPGDGEPIFRLQTDVDSLDPAHVFDIAAHLVVPNSSQESKDEQPWVIASRSLWHQLLENLWVFHVVLAGKQVANPITDPLLVKYESLWGYGDMRYQLSTEGSWFTLDSPNPFRELLELAKETHRRIATFE